MVKKADPGNVAIAILQRGWVMVGRLSRAGDQVHLENASVIRRWGTTNGLGELATEGPKQNTVLDPTGKVQFHELTAIAIISCQEDKWSTHLK
jgi:hypothetical protein